MNHIKRIRTYNIFMAVVIGSVGISFVLKDFIGNFFFQFFMVSSLLIYSFITIQELIAIVRHKKRFILETETIISTISLGIFMILALIHTEYKKYYIFWYSKMAFGILLIINTILKLLFNKLYK